MSSETTAAIITAAVAAGIGVSTSVGGAIDRRWRLRVARTESTDAVRRTVLEDVVRFAAACERMAYGLALDGDPRAESFALARRCDELISDGRLRLYVPDILNPVITLARKYQVLHSELTTAEMLGQHEGRDVARVWHIDPDAGLEDRQQAVTAAALALIDAAQRALPGG